MIKMRADAKMSTSLYKDIITNLHFLIQYNFWMCNNEKTVKYMIQHAKNEVEIFACKWIHMLIS